jgi:hypothetical protein
VSGIGNRLLLNLLQPHLARFWLAGRTNRLLSSALAELDRVDEHDPRGVILLGLGGEVEFASPPTERLLRESSRPGAADGFRLRSSSGSSPMTRSH